MSQRSPAAAAPEARPRAPGLVGLAAALAMLAIIVPLAVRFSQAPAETIAEFAPQVNQQIHKAPNNQSAINGQGQGAGLAGSGSSPSPSPSPPGAQQFANTPSELQCVQSPGSAARQIADTQSPPCIPYWNGNNGGSTYRGVTGNTINIGMWVEASGSTQKELENDLIKFFNNHFELYGRKLNLVEEIPGTGCSSTSGTPGERQEADRLYSMSTFVALDPYYESGGCFVDESARHQMLTVTSFPYFTEAQMASYAPYMWSYYASSDKEMADTGDYVCSSMAGRPASHASGEDTGTTPPVPMNQATRKFGAILQYDETPLPMSLQPLTDALARCGVTLADSKLMPELRSGGQYTDFESPQTFQQIMAQFQSEGITSVILFGLPFLEQYFSSGADTQQYHPEWLMPSTMWTNDWDAILRLFWPNSDQRASQLFGLTWGPRQVAYQSSPAQWAISDTDPSYVFPTSSNSSATVFARLNEAYHELLLAASGIQLAGPNLNPQTFANGLMATQFPNPRSWQQEGAVDFPGVHYMTQDSAIWWWGESTPSVYQDEGAFSLCYENHGARYSGRSYPSNTDDYFTASCDNGAKPP